MPWKETPLDLIFKNCARHRLLSREEEIELARRVQAGGKDGLRAKEELIRHNYKLVLSMVLKYARDADCDTQASYFQEGVIGLNRAVEKFDPTKGYKFSTYAHWWIRQAINRYESQKTRMIRLPDHLHQKRLTLKREIAAHRAKYNRAPTHEELAAIATAADLSLEKLNELKLLDAHSSLDAPVDGLDGESPLGGILPSRDDVWDFVETEEKGAMWGAIAAQLSPEEVEAFEHRYFENLSPQEVADRMGIPLPKVRSLINGGRRKARAIAQDLKLDVRALLAG